MQDDKPTSNTEEEVVDTALTIGLVGFLVLLVGAGILEGTGYYRGAMDYFPFLLTIFAILGVAWLLWKSPINPQ